MKFGVLGTGMVGETIGAKLVERGHEVKIGSRSATNEKALAWASKAGKGASVGTFADAAQFGEVVFVCTKGEATVDVVTGVADKLAGKVVIDVTNPLDFSKGFPPSLFISNTDSLGEHVQRAAPKARVVKSLNTMTCVVMVDANAVKGDHTVFVSGNDADAKATVSRVLGENFGWKPANVIDLGDITTARGAEMILPLWVRLYGVMKSPMFNFSVVK